MHELTNGNLPYIIESVHECILKIYSDGNAMLNICKRVTFMNQVSEISVHKTSYVFPFNIICACFVVYKSES